MKSKEYKGIEVLSFEQLNISHGFTTRKGGVSRLGYGSLNLGLNSKDERSSVQENYRRFFEALNIDGSRTAATFQVHSAHIERIDDLNAFKVFNGTDGLITNQPGITLMTYYADCTPLYFHDPVKGVVGMAHSGWKGTEQKIGSIMVKRLAEEYGCRPEDLVAGIGPNISFQAYEVDDLFLTRFSHPEYFKPFFRKTATGRFHFDLVESNRAILIDSGILPENILESNHCTYNEPDLFFSYRRQGEESGRMSGFIRLE